MAMGLDSIAGLIGTVGAGIGSAIGRGISSFASGLNQPLGGNESSEGEDCPENGKLGDSVNINFAGIHNEAPAANLPQLGWLAGDQ